MRRIALGVLALAACGRSVTVVTADAGAPETVAIQQPAAAAPPPEPKPDDSQIVAMSVAEYAKNGAVLDECDDFTFVSHGFDAGADWGSTMKKRFFAKPPAGRKASDAVILPNRCVESFRDKTWLATCDYRHTQSVKSDAGVELGTVDVSADVYYYDLASLSDDHWSKDCLSMGGNWTGVDKNSDGYREAVRARSRRELEGLQKQFGQPTY